MKVLKLLILFVIPILFTKNALAQTLIPLELSQKVQDFYNSALGIGAALAMAIIAFAGFVYITSAGNPSAQSNARKWVWAAISGMLVLFSSFVFVRFINPNLTSLSDIAIERSPDSIVTTIEIPPGGLFLPPSDTDPGTFLCKLETEADGTEKCVPDEIATSTCQPGFTESAIACSIYIPSMCDGATASCVRVPTCYEECMIVYDDSVYCHHFFPDSCWVVKDGFVYPPNLGSVNSEGYYKFPDSLSGDYIFSGGTPEYQRCGTLTLIGVIYTVIDRKSVV